MTEPSKRTALESSLEIDRICDEFEQNSAGVDALKIEDCLEQVDTELQTKLLEQLLAIELERLDSRPLLADYTHRFPNFKTCVETVFEELDLLDWTDSKIGRYRVIEELGRGGMGVVFLANDPNLNRQIAIKLLTRDRRSDSRWLRRFRQEARLASGLNHPNILTIYEIGEDKDTPYIASEFVDGSTLRKRIGKAPLPLQQAIEYAHQIANGMAAAHRAGIIHRDLKADNIMVRRDGLVKILDFGLAQQNHFLSAEIGSQSTTGSIAGTVHFMSPEQARGQKLTGATDVFSFGVVLYLMFTGELPFRGPTTSDAIAQILNSEPNAISRSGIEIPTDLEDVISSCLRKDQDSRPTFDTLFEKIEGLRQRHVGDEFQQPLVLGSNPDLDSESDITIHPELTFADNITGGLQPSEIRYAQSDDVSIAWQEIGSGAIDIVFVMGWVSHLEWFWKDPSFSKFLRRLATFARVILFDKRGTGLSDKVPVRQLPDLETRMDDVRAVMDAANSDQAVLCGISEGGPLSALFAATHPDKTIALTMIGSYSRRLWAEDYPWGPTAEQREKFLDIIGNSWGGPVGIEDRAPSLANDAAFRDWWACYLRMGASPGAAIALTKMNAQIDVRPILPSIHVPTLVIHRTDDRCLRVEEGRHLAEKIPGAQFVELPGEDHLPFVGDADSILDEIEIFLTGITGNSQVDCVLATVLCVEILNATSEATVQFEKMVKREIALFRGQNFFSAEKSILVTFDGPVRSALCASAIGRLASRLEIEIKSGLDTGTCNIDKSVIYGPAVNGAKSVAATAPIGLVLVTKSLRSLISGTEVMFEEFSSENTQLFRVVNK